MAIEGLTQEVSVSSGGAQTSAQANANLDTISIDANALDDLPILDQDVVASMSRFLDSSAIGTGGTTIVVDGVEVNALSVFASAVQQIKINQDPYSAEFARPGRGRIEIVTKPGGKDYSGTLNLRFATPRSTPETRSPRPSRPNSDGFSRAPSGDLCREQRRRTSCCRRPTTRGFANADLRGDAERNGPAECADPEPLAADGKHFTLVEAVTWSPRNQVNRLGTFYFSTLDDYAASRPYSFSRPGTARCVFSRRCWAPSCRTTSV